MSKEEPSSVLLVEADVLVRHPLAEYLRDCGYRVIEAQGSEEAKQFFAAHGSMVDVVLVDAGNATDNGFILAGWIRANHPNTQVMLAGSHASAAERVGELCEEGPELKKPYEHKIVLDRIHCLIAARTRKQE